MILTFLCAAVPRLLNLFPSDTYSGKVGTAPMEVASWRCILMKAFSGVAYHRNHREWMGSSTWTKSGSSSKCVKSFLSFCLLVVCFTSLLLRCLSPGWLENIYSHHSSWEPFHLHRPLELRCPRKLCRTQAGGCRAPSSTVFKPLPPTPTQYE